MGQSDNLFLQYIETINNPIMQRNLRSAYKWIHDYEETHSVEIGHMTKDQLIDMVNAQKSATPNTIRNWLIMLKGFSRWQTQTGYRTDSPSNGLALDDIDLAGGCSAHYFRTYTELFNMLRRFWKPNEGFQIFPISIFAWIGIPKKEAEELTKDQISVDKQQIIGVNGQRYQLTDIMSNTLNEFEGFAVSKRGNRITMTRPYNTDLFMCRWDWMSKENLVIRPVDITVTMNAASKILKSKQVYNFLTYDNIAKAGALNRMYLAEKEGASENSIIASAYPILKSPQGYPGDVKLIYEAYKAAFSLK